jgi:hypothetical protein
MPVLGRNPKAVSGKPEAAFLWLHAGAVSVKTRSEEPDVRGVHPYSPTLPVYTPARRLMIMTPATSFSRLALLRWLFAASSLLLLAACSAGLPHESGASREIDWVATSPAEGSSAKWEHRSFPGKKSTLYLATRLDGREVIQSESSSAASMLRQHVRVEHTELGKFRFSWKVAELIDGADMRQRDGDDSPVRVVLAFEGDRARFSEKNAMLSELSMVLTGEPLPFATLMYVWGNHSEPGSVIVNSRTDRIRKLVLESGPGQLGRWLDYERDISADYQQAFGEAPGALVGIGLMTDSDNTRQRTAAWYGPMTLWPRQAGAIAKSASPAASSAAFLSP